MAHGRTSCGCPEAQESTSSPTSRCHAEPQSENESAVLTLDEMQLRLHSELVGLLILLAQLEHLEHLGLLKLRGL